MPPTAGALAGHMPGTPARTPWTMNPTDHNPTNHPNSPKIHAPGDMPASARTLEFADAEGSARFLKACKRLHALADILDTQPCVHNASLLFCPPKCTPLYYIYCIVYTTLLVPRSVARMVRAIGLRSICDWSLDDVQLVV